MRLCIRVLFLRKPAKRAIRRYFFVLTYSITVFSEPWPPRGFFFKLPQASRHSATKTSSGFPLRGPKGKYSILSREPMVGSDSRLSPIVADCCSHAAIPILAVTNDSMTASVTLWYYFKQLLEQSQNSFCVKFTLKSR